MEILFVCTGNTCRSPMAEMIMKEKLKRYKMKNVTVDSAGLQVYEAQPMNELAMLALKSRNVSVTNHKSKQITYDLVRNADYIITRDPKHFKFSAIPVVNGREYLNK